MTRPAAQAAAWVAALLERTAVVGAGERRCGANLVWEGGRGEICARVGVGARARMRVRVRVRVRMRMEVRVRVRVSVRVRMSAMVSVMGG